MSAAVSAVVHCRWRRPSLTFSMSFKIAHPLSSRASKYAFGLLIIFDTGGINAALPQFWDSEHPSALKDGLVRLEGEQFS